MTIQNSETINKFIVITGFIALLLSIVMGVQFYSSLAHSVVGQITYIGAGALLTCLVVLTLTLALHSFGNNFPIMGVMLTLLWGVLISLEILAEFGFLATQQERRAAEIAKDSAQARLAEDSVKGAQARVDSLAKYANIDINAKRAELERLQGQLSDAQARLQACPANYRTNCINPARAEINRLQAAMTPLQTVVEGYEQYAGALTSKSSASSALSGALSGKDIGLAISPAYTWLARLTGICAENIQAGTSILIATLLSIWASFAGFVLLRFQSIKTSNPLKVTDVTGKQTALSKEELTMLLNAHLKELASPKA